MLSIRLGRSDIFLGDISVRPWLAQVEKLEFQESDHLDFRGETPSFKYSFVAMIAFLVFVIVAPVRIQFSFSGVGGARNN